MAVVDRADEELRTVGVGPGVGHGDRPWLVLTVDGFIVEPVSGTAATRAFRAAALDDEVVDDAMEGETVVEAVASEEDEVVHRLGRTRRVQCDDDIAAIGGDGGGVALCRIDHLLSGGVFLGHRGSLPGVAGQTAGPPSGSDCGG